jgi:hypothetical protein
MTTEPSETSQESPNPQEPATPPATTPPAAVPERPPAVQNAPSKIYSVRLPIVTTDSLIALHYKVKHIPEPTDSAFLRYLVIQDAEKMRDDIKKRQGQVIR